MTWTIFLWLVIGFVVLLIACFVMGAMKVAGEADEASEEMLLEMERLDYYENNPHLAERLDAMFGAEAEAEEGAKDGRKVKTWN